MSNTIIRWNNLARRFDTISVDALNEKVHDVGNSRPTQFVKNVKDAGKEK